MEVSIIIPSHNEGVNLKNTLESITKNTEFEDYEIVVVDDASTDNSTNFLKSDFKDVKLIKTNVNCSNKARNIGAKNAIGDVLFFLDAHVFPLTKFWMEDLFNFVKKYEKSVCGPCISVYGSPEVKGYGFSVINTKLNIDWLPKKTEVPYEVPMIGSACLVTSAKNFRKIGQFNDNFLSWGYDDIEFCIRSWLMGYRIFVLPNVDVAHLFRSNLPYPVKNEDILYNLLITYILHLKHSRMDKLVSDLSCEINVNILFDLVRKNNILNLRKISIKKRVHDDDWFFDKFGIKIN